MGGEPEPVGEVHAGGQRLRIGAIDRAVHPLEVEFPPQRAAELVQPPRIGEVDRPALVHHDIVGAASAGSRGSWRQGSGARRRYRRGASARPRRSRPAHHQPAVAIERHAVSHARLGGYPADTRALVPAKPLRRGDVGEQQVAAVRHPDRPSVNVKPEPSASSSAFSSRRSSMRWSRTSSTRRLSQRRPTPPRRRSARRSRRCAARMRSARCRASDPSTSRAPRSPDR